MAAKRPNHDPAMDMARNIVNQVLDKAGTDECDEFVAWMLTRYAEQVGE